MERRLQYVKGWFHNSQCDMNELLEKLKILLMNPAESTNLDSLIILPPC